MFGVFGAAVNSPKSGAWIAGQGRSVAAGCAPSGKTIPFQGFVPLGHAARQGLEGGRLSLVDKMD